MKLPFKKKIYSLSDSKLVSKKFSSLLTNGNIVLLEGNLGTGKTTFVNLICSNFGITETTSPSFSIVNEYSSKFKVYHFDFYRIKKKEELFDIGFFDYLNDEEAIIFIEWADLFPEVIPEKYYKISIKFVMQDVREVQIVKKNNIKWKKIN